jgi:putative selenate reductase molybdopterin-binding subunit
VVGAGPKRRGIGMAIVMQASGIPGVDMGAAALKMNEDASFNLTMGATDIGTGSDTMFCQIAAETLGVPIEKIIPYSSDTDMTPFDPGAYASSTTYISGRAVEKAARAVLSQIIEVGGRLLEEDPKELVTHGGKVCAKDGRSVTYEQVCLSSLYQHDQFQIMAGASHMSYDSPPPFAAVFAEVEVDVETGLVTVLKLVEAVDCGQVINPQMAEGQVEGAAVQALGYALFERMPFDAKGRMQFRSFRDYTIATASDVRSSSRSWCPRTSPPALRRQGDRRDPDQRTGARDRERRVPRDRRRASARSADARGYRVLGPRLQAAGKD